MRDLSPNAAARVAGLLYLLLIGVQTFAEIFVRSGLIVQGDAAETAANILAQEQVYRFGGAAQLVTVLCDVALSVLFYALMRPAGRVIAMLASAFRLASIVLLAVATIAHFAPLYFLQGEIYARAFTEEQLQALAMLALRLHSAGYNICLLLFGVHLLLLGLLILRSRFFPWIIGALLVLAGLGYVVNSFAFFAYPALTALTFPVMIPVAFVAETSFALWLLVMGVNEAKWRDASVADRASS